ncbi:MAG: ThuA domain-containing protein [Verrucomicrobiota bacterium]
MQNLKSLFPIIALITVASAGLWYAQAQEGKRVYKVLIIDGQNNHKWKATTPVLKHALETSGRFAVDISTSPPKKAEKGAWTGWKPAFSDYDAVLSNYNGEMWPEEVQDSFLAYVEGGGAFVVVHAANNSFGQWKEYNEIIGLGGWGGRNEKSGPLIYFKDGELVRDTSPGRGGTHGAQWEFNVDVIDTEHPITKGMPQTWKHAKDELYSLLRGPGKNMKVLATSKSKKTNRDEPMIMTLDYGQGRVFHTPMGHADYSMRCAGFYNVLQRGTEWAISGNVTIPIPENFPTADTLSPIEEK